MSSHLQPLNDHHPIPRQPSRRDRGPLPAPAWFTKAGALDREAEQDHTLAVRQEVRLGEHAQFREARHLTEDLATMERRARLVDEAKFTLEEARRRSVHLAGEDPVLKAQYAILDDDLFHSIRSQVLRDGR